MTKSKVIQNAWSINSSLGRSAATLLSGTALAHLVTLLSALVITRIYEPNAYGVYALLSGIVATLSVAACLRWEVAIPIADTEEEAHVLLILALAAAIATSGFVAVMLMASPVVATKVLGNLQSGSFVVVVPIALFAIASSNAIGAYALRGNRFKLLAISKLVHSSTANSTQIGLGLTPLNSQGLLLGYALGALAHLLSISALLPIRRFFFALRKMTYARAKTIALKYRAYPTLSTAEALFASLSIHLPIMMIASRGIASDAGFVLMAMYVLHAPLSLMAGAIGSVYHSRVSQEIREGSVAAFTEEILGKLLRLGIGPVVAIAVLAPQMARYVFGENWDRVGTLSAWMAPWFLMHFLATTVSMSLHATGNQAKALLLQLFGLLIRTGSVAAALALHHQVSAEVYAISGAMQYSVFLIVVSRVTRAVPSVWLTLALKSPQYWAPWICAAIAISLIVK